MSSFFTYSASFKFVLSTTWLITILCPSAGKHLDFNNNSFYLPSFYYLPFTIFLQFIQSSHISSLKSIHIIAIIIRIRAILEEAFRSGKWQDYVLKRLCIEEVMYWRGCEYPFRAQCGIIRWDNPGRGLRWVSRS